MNVKNKKHKHLKHPKYEMDQGLEKQYNCIDCDFQASTETQLEKHVNLKHKVFINSESKERFYCHACDLHLGKKVELIKHSGLKHAKESLIECRYCGEHFNEKWSFMNHRKSKHLNTVAPCQKYREGNCSFSKEMCWWRHEDQNGWKEDGRIQFSFVMMLLTARIV